MGTVNAAGAGIPALKAAMASGHSQVKIHQIGDETWPIGRYDGGQAGADRAFELAEIAAREALDAHPALKDIAPGRRALSLGTTCGGLLNLEALAQAQNPIQPPPRGPLREVSAYHYLTQALAEALEIHGPKNTLTVACASGSQALLYGADLLEADRADLVLAGGVDTVSTFILKGFKALRALGKLPYLAFDGQSTGVLLGEGAAFFALTTLNMAQRLDLPIVGSLLGGATNNDNYAIARPDPEGRGIEYCLRQALASAELSPADIDVIGAHGTGNRVSDQAEMLAYGRIFQEKLSTCQLSALKPLVGHLSGAAGALEIAALLLNLSGHAHYLRAFDGQKSHGMGGHALKRALKLSSGFGGNNCALVLGDAPVTPDPSRRGGISKRKGQSTPQNHRVFITQIAQIVEGDAAFSGDGITVISPDFRPGDLFKITGLQPTKESRRLDKYGAILALGALLALKDPCFAPSKRDDEGIPLFVGSALGCWQSAWNFAKGLKGGRVNPVTYQNTVSNAVLGYLGMMLGGYGPSHLYSAGPMAGVMALMAAMDQIRLGKIPHALVGGGDFLQDLTPDSSAGKKPLAMGQGADGHRVNGAVFLRIEGEESLRNRGGKPLAELLSLDFEPPQQEKPLPCANNQHVFALPERIEGLYTRASQSPLGEAPLNLESSEAAAFFKGVTANTPMARICGLIGEIHPEGMDFSGDSPGSKGASLAMSDGRGGRFTIKVSATALDNKP